MLLTAAANQAEFSAAPLGQWIGGGSFVYAWPGPQLCVSLLWGAPTRQDFETLIGLYRLELGPLAAPHAAVIDARRVSRVEPVAFEMLARYVEATREALRTTVTRLAIVRPDGFVGAVAAGFYETVEPPYPVEVCADLAAALAWCDTEPSHRAELSRQLEQLVDGAADMPAFLLELSRALQARLPDASMAGAARDLGITVRTMQRRLKQLDTSYRQQLARTQVRLAQQALIHSDAAITTIAYQLGCSTPQRFSAIFREATGCTPSAWRRAHRQAD